MGHVDHTRVSCQNAAVLKPFIAVALTDTLYRLASAVLYLESDSCLFQVAVLDSGRTLHAITSHKRTVRGCTSGLYPEQQSPL